MKTLKFAELEGKRGNYHLAITRVGAGRSTFLHDHDFYEWFVVSGGSGWHELRKEEGAGEGKAERSQIRLRPGMLVFVHPQDTHAFAAMPEERLEFVNLALASDWWDKYAALHQPRLELVGESAATQTPFHWQLDDVSASRVLECLLGKLKSQQAGAGDLLEMVTLLTGLWMRITQVDTAPAWLRQLRTEMLHPAQLGQGIRDWQERSGYSAAHLSREVRRHYGVSPTEMLNRARVEYFCFLLRTRPIKILAAAQEAGFQQLANFYKAFRRIHGCHPRAWLARAEKTPTVPGH